MPGFKESMMAKMTKAEQFADELWTHGPQMGNTQETHRQMVMNVIRAHIRNP
jgi:hypothetical protein